MQYVDTLPKETELDMKHFYNKLTTDNDTESRWQRFKVKTFYILVDVFTT